MSAILTKELSPKELANVLRSGRYQKGIGALCNHNVSGMAYCCLGVYAEECGILREHKYVTYAGTKSTTSLIDIAPEWMLREFDFFNHQRVIDILINLNDSNSTWWEVINFLEEL